MRALITNDDGVGSAGIRALATVARKCGLEVTVAAPAWDSSGASASLTAVEHEGRLLLDRRAFEEFPDVPVFGVEAAPAFIVRAAASRAFGPPGAGTSSPIIAAWPTIGCSWPSWMASGSPPCAALGQASLASGAAATTGRVPARSCFLLNLAMSKLTFSLH